MEFSCECHDILEFWRKDNGKLFISGASNSKIACCTFALLQRLIKLPFLERLSQSSLEQRGMK